MRWLRCRIERLSLCMCAATTASAASSCVCACPDQSTCALVLHQCLGSQQAPAVHLAGAVYLLDACQSVGQLPLDVSALRCHLLTGTGRKWLRAPRGCGFLYASDALLDDERVEPAALDVRGGVWSGDRGYEAAAGARRYEEYEMSFAAKARRPPTISFAGSLASSQQCCAGAHCAGTWWRARVTHQSAPRHIMRDTCVSQVRVCHWQHALRTRQLQVAARVHVGRGVAVQLPLTCTAHTV
jgi:Aminotransferase class-V